MSRSQILLETWAERDHRYQLHPSSLIDAATIAAVRTWRVDEALDLGAGEPVEYMVNRAQGWDPPRPFPELGRRKHKLEA